MKALVTGSEGFIGKNLVARLEKDGNEVIGFDPKSYTTGRDIIERRHTADVIYHLGCINQMQATKFPKQNLEVNALLTRDLAVYAKAIGARFVYTSTASVYGAGITLPLQIGDPERPVTEYGVAKLAGEKYVQQIGGDYLIYRLSNVYGPHQTLDNPYCGVIGRFIEANLSNQPMTVIGSGLQTRDFSFVDDVTEILAYTEPPVGLSRLNQISSGKETSVLEIAMTIGRMTGEETKITWIDPRPIDTVDRRVLRPVYPANTPLEDGLEKTIAWMRSKL